MERAPLTCPLPGALRGWIRPAIDDRSQSRFPIDEFTFRPACVSMELPFARAGRSPSVAGDRGSLWRGTVRRPARMRNRDGETQAAGRLAV